MHSESFSSSVGSDSLQPHGPQPIGLLCPRHSPGKNTGVSCHVLLQGILLIQGIFLTMGSNPGFLCCRQIFYHLSHIREDLNVIAKTISLRRKQRYKYHNLEFGNGFLVMMLKAKEIKENCTYIQFLQNQKCLGFKGYHQYNVNQTYSMA